MVSFAVAVSAGTSMIIMFSKADSESVNCLANCDTRFCIDCSS